MQAEDERRARRFRDRSPRFRRAKAVADGAADLGDQPGLFRQARRRLGQCPGVCRSSRPDLSVLTPKVNSAQARQGVSDQGFVPDVPPPREVPPDAEQRIRARVVRHCRAAQRFADDVLRRNGYTEEAAGHGGDLILPCSGEPSPAIVALVPMQRRFVALSRSRTRRTSMATSAPCRPR